MTPMTNINPVPWSLVIAALAVIGGFYLFHAGQQSCAMAHKAELAEHLSRAAEQARAQALVDADILHNAAKAEQVLLTRTRLIAKEVARHVDARPEYRECRIDECGLCLAHAAFAQTDPARCPCEPDATLRGTARTTGGDGRIAQSLRGDGEFVSPVSGTAGGAGGVGGGRP